MVQYTLVTPAPLTSENEPHTRFAEHLLLQSDCVPHAKFASYVCPGHSGVATGLYSCPAGRAPHSRVRKQLPAHWFAVPHAVFAA